MKNLFSLFTASRSLNAIALSVLLTTTQAWAGDQNTRRVAWDDSLNLSEQQEEQIEEIENRYRNNFRDLMSSDDRNGLMKKKHELHQQMRDEIHSVLNEEQKAVALQQMQDRREQVQQKHVKKLQRMLDLSDEQSQALQAQLLERSPAAWPMDKEQMEGDRKHFKQVMQAVLNEDQLQRWQSMHEENKKKWRNHGEEQLPEFDPAQ
ncbi:MAG: hypothetical protein P1U57_12745 [Oleibacter sp.]|nr:hypothetical protein [Thalassolituus sp.]